MSKVPITIDVDRFLCDELEVLRRCNETRDFSLVPGTVERIQLHANAMEGGLHAYKSLLYTFREIIEDEKISDKEKLETILEKVNKRLKHY